MDKFIDLYVSTVEVLSGLQLCSSQQIGPCPLRSMNLESLRALQLKTELNQPHYKKRKFTAVYLCN